MSTTPGSTGVTTPPTAAVSPGATGAAASTSTTTPTTTPGPGPGPTNPNDNSLLGGGLAGLLFAGIGALIFGLPGLLLGLLALIPGIGKMGGSAIDGIGSLFGGSPAPSTGGGTSVSTTPAPSGPGTPPVSRAPTAGTPGTPAPTTGTGTPSPTAGTPATADAGLPPPIEASTPAAGADGDIPATPGQTALGAGAVLSAVGWMFQTIDPQRRALYRERMNTAGERETWLGRRAARTTVSAVNPIRQATAIPTVELGQNALARVYNNVRWGITGAGRAMGYDMDLPQVDNSLRYMPDMGRLSEAGYRMRSHYRFLGLNFGEYRSVIDQHGNTVLNRDARGNWKVAGDGAAHEEALKNEGYRKVIEKFNTELAKSSAATPAPATTAAVSPEPTLTLAPEKPSTGRPAPLPRATETFGMQPPVETPNKPTSTPAPRSAGAAATPTPGGAAGGTATATVPAVKPLAASLEVVNRSGQAVLRLQMESYQQIQDSIKGMGLQGTKFDPTGKPTVEIPLTKENLARFDPQTRQSLEAQTRVTANDPVPLGANEAERIRRTARMDLKMALTLGSPKVIESGGKAVLRLDYTESLPKSLETSGFKGVKVTPGNQAVEVPLTSENLAKFDAKSRTHLEARAATVTPPEPIPLTPAPKPTVAPTTPKPTYPTAERAPVRPVSVPEVSPTAPAAAAGGSGWGLRRPSAGGVGMTALSLVNTVDAAKRGDYKTAAVGGGISGGLLVSEVMGWSRGAGAFGVAASGLGAVDGGIKIVKPQRDGGGNITLQGKVDQAVGGVQVGGNGYLMVMSTLAVLKRGPKFKVGAAPVILAIESAKALGQGYVTYTHRDQVVADIEQQREAEVRGWKRLQVTGAYIKHGEQLEQHQRDNSGSAIGEPKPTIQAFSQLADAVQIANEWNPQLRGGEGMRDDAKALGDHEDPAKLRQYLRMTQAYLTEERERVLQAFPARDREKVSEYATRGKYENRLDFNDTNDYVIIPIAEKTITFTAGHNQERVNKRRAVERLNRLDMQLAKLESGLMQIENQWSGFWVDGTKKDERTQEVKRVSFFIPDYATMYKDAQKRQEGLKEIVAKSGEIEKRLNDSSIPKPEEMIAKLETIGAGRSKELGAKWAELKQMQELIEKRRAAYDKEQTPERKAELLIARAAARDALPTEELNRFLAAQAEENKALALKLAAEQKKFPVIPELGGDERLTRAEERYFKALDAIGEGKKPTIVDMLEANQAEAQYLRYTQIALRSKEKEIPPAKAAEPRKEEKVTFHSESASYEDLGNKQLPTGLPAQPVAPKPDLGFSA